MLDRFVQCPSCNADLRLDKSERVYKSFACPSCGRQVSDSDPIKSSSQQSSGMPSASSSNPIAQVVRFYRWSVNKTPPQFHPVITFIFFYFWLWCLVAVRYFVTVLFVSNSSVDLTKLPALVHVGFAGIGATFLVGLMKQSLTSLATAKPWILGLASSATFWSIMEYLQPSHNTRFELTVVIVVFGVLFGFLLRINARIFLR
jgi:hypothetical protein